MRVVAIAIASLLSLALGCKDDPASRFSESKIELTQIIVKKLAFEAYPQWAAANSTKACPDSLDPLVEYMPEQKAVDAWGRSLQMYCGANLPPGAKGLAVTSSGPDGVAGNTDDIKSW